MEKFVVLEHLFFPDRGLRFWTGYTEGKDQEKLLDGRTAYKVVKVTEDSEEAKLLSQLVDWNAIHQGEDDFQEMLRDHVYPKTVNEKVYNSWSELSKDLN